MVLYHRPPPFHRKLLCCFLCFHVSSITCYSNRSRIRVDWGNTSPSASGLDICVGRCHHNVPTCTDTRWYMPPFIYPFIHPSIHPSIHIHIHIKCKQYHCTWALSWNGCHQGNTISYTLKMGTGVIKRTLCKLKQNFHTVIWTLWYQK